MSKPPKRKTLTPQQKKQLSLRKDRRERYGQNDKASRKLVPLRKAQAQRRVRRADKQMLDRTLALGDAQTLAPRRAKPDFIKWPGAALGDDIADRAMAALKRDGRKTRTKVEEIAWFDRFYGPAIAARMRALYIKFGWIED